MKLYLMLLARRAYPYRRAIQMSGLLLLLFAGCMMATGCAGLPGWLNAIEATIPLVSATLGTILTAIAAALGGDPALAAAAQLIAEIATKGMAAIKDIQAMVAEYQANPSTTLLGKIEEAIKAATDTMQQLLGDIGVPAPLAGIIQNLAQVVLSQLEAWANVLPALTSLETNGAGEARAMLAAIPTEQHPLDAKHYAAKINEIISAPTGDEKADAILAGIPRLEAA
jgi:hypothetical protein